MQIVLRLALTRIVKRGRLRVRTAEGLRFEVGDGSGELAELCFHDVAAQWAFLRDPDMRFGELYMDGRITIGQGTLYQVIFLLLQDFRTQPAPLLLRAIDWFRFATRRSQQRNIASASKSNAAHHYDLDVGFYRLFLDADLQYSCAYFERPEQSLDDAQLAKKRHIASKLLVEPGQRVLDIGCGWGGLALYLSQIAGAGDVLGISLAEQQIAEARDRQSRLALVGQLNFELMDYRAVNGTFDRIVSVGMFEHVGIGFYGTFFESCHRLLDKNGVMMLHTIGCSDGPGYVSPWVTKYIFPGGSIPALSEVIPAIERAGLIVSDVEILQLHYAWTIRAWRERFEARRDEAKRLYDERFCRMWEFYLAAAEVAFRCEALNIFQIQISKAPAITPYTRGYVELREAKLRIAEQQAAG